MIRLIGIDVDGTLLDSRGHLPEANRDAIHDAVAAGVHVALVTGRSYPFARPVADPLPSIHLAHRQQRRGGAGDGRRHVSRGGCSTARRRRRARGDASAIADHAALVFDRDEREPGGLRDDGLGTSGPEALLVAEQRISPQAVPLEDALTEDPIQVMFNGAVEAMRALARRARSRCRRPGLRRAR